MKGKKGLLSIGILVLILVITLGNGLAKEDADRDKPQGELVIEGIVSSKFSYQGILHESGTPVNGTRDIVFHLFSDDSCTTFVGGSISMPGVQVVDGFFSVELPVSSSYFSGQALWLDIQVDGTVVGCQEILPVPYAISLRPGARIEGLQANWDAIHAVNTAETGQSYGIYARSNSTSGRGVYGYASAVTGVTYGVYGRSESSSGAGVYARGIDDGADLLLGGNANTTLGDDGRILSDPDYPSSDIHLITNDGLRIDLDQDFDEEDADFEIRAGDDTLIFNVDESGTITFGGSGIAAFPRPAYDSGWATLSQGVSANRTHNIGGNVENYVVDLTCRRISGGAGINNWGLGGDVNSPDEYGAWWTNLTTTSIALHRGDNDTDCPQVRVRIWLYP
jgi:hypothetical protein